MSESAGHGARLVIGTAQLGMSYGVANVRGQLAVEEARTILQHARLSGVDALDTAIAYGDSEERLGRIGVPEWKVVSKLPSAPQNGTDLAGWAADCAASSLRRLRLDRLYGLLLHRPVQLLEKDGPILYEALLQLKDRGVVSKIGASVYEPAEAEALIARYELDLIQVPFSVFDRRLLTSGCLARLRERRVEVHVRSVFLQGLLLASARDLPRKFHAWRQAFESWNIWLERSGLSPLQACLRYVMQFAEVDRVVVGVDSLRHLTEILAAADGAALAVPDSLSSTDLDLINPSRWAALEH